MISNKQQMLSDRYELCVRLHARAVGEAYRAIDHVDGTEVQLTLLPASMSTDWQDISKRVFCLQQGGGNSCAAVLSCHKTASAAFVTSELVCGKSLRDEVTERSRTERRYSMEEVRQVLDQISKAIEPLHATTFHGQIGLETIIRLPDGSLKLGVPAWHLPEIDDPVALSAAKRDDQRMLAAVIFELLTWTVPDHSSNSIRKYRPGVPLEFSNTIQRALDASPEKRFKSMAAFRNQMLLPTSPVVGKDNLLLVSVFVAAVILVGGLGWKVWPKSNSATRADFARVLGQIESQKEVAEQIDSQIMVDAANAREEIDKWQRELLTAQSSDKPLHREYAEQRLAEIQHMSEIQISLGDIWSQHRNKAAWMTEAAGLLASAKSHAEDGDLDQAMKELTDTEVTWKRFSHWRQNAQQVVEISRRTQAKLASQIAGGESSGWAYEFPTTLLNGLNSRLMDDDGESALSDVQNAESSLPVIASLLELRSGVLQEDEKAASLDQIREARVERQKLRELLSQADSSLRTGRFSECESLLKSVQKALQSIPLIALREMYQAAQQSLNAGKNETATRMIDQMLEVVAEQEEANRIKAESLALRADLSSREGKFESALADCEQSLEMLPTSAAYVVRASILNVRGEFEGALTEANAALRIDPNSAEALNQRGFANYQNGDFTTAIADFDQVLSLSPGFADALTNRGLVYLDQADSDKAARDFEAALKIQPSDFQALVGRGCIHRLKGDFASAIQDCDAALNTQPNFGEALVCRGAARLGIGTVEGAITDLKKAIELDSNDIAAHVFLATAYNELKQFDLAVRESELAIDIDHNCTEARLQRALGLVGLKKYVDAEADLSAVLETSPRLALALLARADIRMKDQRPADAIQDFTVVLQDDPKCVDALAGRATANVLLGHFDIAITDCTQVIQLDPKHAQGYRTRAVAHAKLKHSEDVISDCSAAISLNSQSVECFTMRAAAYLEKAELQKAIEDCTSAIQLSPDLVEAWRIRAAARFKAGEKEDATADFNHALRLEEKR